MSVIKDELLIFKNTTSNFTESYTQITFIASFI